MPGDTFNTAPGPAGGALKQVDIRPGATFPANGRTYRVSDSFAIGRLERVTLLEEELALLGDQGSCHEVMLRAMEHINNYKPGEAYTLMYNKIESDRKNARLIHYTLRACTAYINADDEDLRYLSEEQIAEKLHDWSEEGLDIRPFMSFAVNVFREHLRPYQLAMQDILKEQGSVSDLLSTVLDITTSIEAAGSGPETS